MTNDEELHALYRFRGKGRRQPPLYIGRSKNLMRRAEQHRATKTWLPQAVRIDVEWYSAEEIAEAERHAIRREHPLYNIQHNGGRLRIEATAEVTIATTVSRRSGCDVRHDRGDRHGGRLAVGLAG